MVIWLTGLPSSGKTTIAKEFAENLRRKGYTVELLDGDWVRQTINPDAGFTREQRRIHLIRVAWIARLLARNNVITICSFVSPYRDVRAEIRKIIKVIQGVQLNLERAILRLETLRTMTPTLEDIKGVFGEVKGVLEDVARIMPSLTPEINNLTSSINDLMMATEINIVPPEPLAVKSEAAEAILKEASEFLRQEIERKIPEPPEDIPAPKPSEAIKPRIALTIDGSEAYIGEDNSVIGEINDQMNTLAEDLILDYIERNNGVMKISKCAEELNMSKTKVMQILESLSRKGKIRIE